MIEQPMSSLLQRENNILFSKFPFQNFQEGNTKKNIIVEYEPPFRRTLQNLCSVWL